MITAPFAPSEATSTLDCAKLAVHTATPLAVHWVTPDWQDPAADPSGVALTADDAVHEPATGLAPEAPAGPFTLVALTTSAPITVRRVEALGRAACDPAALSALPDAEVAATPLMVPTR